MLGQGAGLGEDAAFERLPILILAIEEVGDLIGFLRRTLFKQ